MTDLNLSLAKCIKRALDKEFEVVHLSGNLLKTIKLIPSANGVSVEIPAEIYDLDLYQKEGIIAYNGQGSYASSIDLEGSHLVYYKQDISPITPRLDKRLTKRGFVNMGDRYEKDLGNHKGYIDRAISKGIAEFIKLNSLRAKVTM